MKKVINYIDDENKIDSDIFDDLHNELEYITNDDKTEKKLNNVVLITINKYINLLCEIDDKVNEILIKSKLKYNGEIKKLK